MPGNNPIQNFRFRVEIDGVSQAGFSEVVMPEGKIDLIEYREGTSPSQVRKLSGLTKYSNIILKWASLTIWNYMIGQNRYCIKVHQVTGRIW